MDGAPGRGSLERRLSGDRRKSGMWSAARKIIAPQLACMCRVVSNVIEDDPGKGQGQRRMVVLPEGVRRNQ